MCVDIYIYIYIYTHMYKLIMHSTTDNDKPRTSAWSTGPRSTQDTMIVVVIMIIVIVIIITTHY